ncbi:MAG: hypothetical protein DHS20C15_09440 [Planctomycetota bacterium]|nr:MAG: hypothetical protein DHS20C15_09440 [Planctomycetota bacterium]
MALRRALLATCLVSLTLACGGGTLDDDLAALEASYHAGDYAAVEAEAPKVLERAEAESAPESKVWKAEKLRLQSLARQGSGKATLAELERLSGAHASKVDAALYVGICNMLAATPEAALDAVDVLDAGGKRFPADAEKFKNLAKVLAESGGDAVNEKLSQLGYL